MDNRRIIRAFKKKQEELRAKEKLQNEEPKKFIISKLVSPLMKNSIPSYEVQWKGYKETTIEPRNQLIRDIAKEVEKVEKLMNIKWSPNTVKYDKQS